MDLRFDITDTGIGIPEEQHDKVFGAFEQTTGQSAAKFGGTGLGLSVSLGIIQAHGGTMGVDSAPGGGAAFHIQIPAATDLSGPVVAPRYDAGDGEAGG